ncbi:MAG TPA: glycosyltransferase [Roseiflexaceae bacterium]|nr:glycosyltransferase [Roseiflexaceae bacterium]
MNKRVLILSTSAGAGHKAAAAALEKIFRGAPGVEQVVNQDALEHTNPAYRAFYADLYLRLVKDNPVLVGWWYDTSDAPGRTDAMRLALDRLNAEPLVAFIQAYRPHITVCTHFMPAGIVAQQIAAGRLDTQLSIVTTDFDFHSMWLSTHFHRYFVALDETRAHLRALGLPAGRITVSGVPVDPAFEQPVDRDAVLARYRLRPDLPILLVSAGAAGGGPARAVVSQLLQLRQEVQVVVVCGTNEGLRRELVKLTQPVAGRFRILGFTDDMPDLMRVATLFIGKPGGLTASECMAAGLPMAIVAPIPGQEERNSDHLLEQGAAIRCNQLTTVAFKIGRLLDDPERLQQMRASARRLGRPDAARVIVETLLREEAAPVVIDAETQALIASAARGEAGPVMISDAYSGEPLGAISEGQLAVLSAVLERESLDDTDFYIDRDTIELLRERGADEDLLALLERAVEPRGEAEIRWERAER